MPAQFEKIFVISLPRRTDHRDRLSVASKVSNLTFEYVDGVPSGTVNKGSLPAAYNDKLQDTVISAWRAHVNVLKKCVVVVARTFTLAPDCLRSPADQLPKNRRRRCVVGFDYGRRSGLGRPPEVCNVRPS